MVLINSSRFGAIILNVYVSLSSCMEAFASTNSAQVSHVVIDLVSPSTGSANASVSAFPTATSLSSTSSSASYITSSSPVPSTLITVSTSSSSSESTSATTTVSPTSTTTRFVDPRTPSASSTSYDLSSSSTESSIATFVPAAPPSNAHIAKLAEIILPSVVGGAGIGAGVGTALWKLFGKLADAASVARALKQAQRVELLDKLTARQEAWNAYIERRVLMEEGRNPGILTTDQVNEIRAVENAGESIWNSKDMPSLPKPCVGVPFCIDWPGSPPGSAPPPGPDPPSDLNPPSGPDPPSDPSPPSNPEPPSGPDPPSDPSPPSNPEPPSGQDPPSDPSLPSDSEPPSGPDPPPGPEPLPPTEESIRLANELPPLPQAVHLNGRFDNLALVRLVPEAYRTLPLDAKIVYVTKYGEDVWSQRLRYFKGAEPAAVDLQNEPLNDWDFDKNGDLVSFSEMGDFKNLPKEKQAKLAEEFVHTRAEIETLQDMEDMERERIANESPPTTPQSPVPEPPQPTPPSPTSPPTPPPPPPPPPPSPHHKHKPKPKHHKHKHAHKKLTGFKCILAWNWNECG